MIILSQDKKTVLETTFVTIREICNVELSTADKTVIDGYEVVAVLIVPSVTVWTKEKQVLGIYKDLERAKEIINEIAACVANNQTYLMPEV